MFERFTDKARRAVVLAQEEARLFGHEHIGTEHLLLGLLREGEGVAGLALGAVGLGLGDVRIDVEERVGAGTERPKGHLAFTPRAKKVLELALRQALRFGHNYIGTEHILLAILDEAEGVAAQVLIARGKLDDVREDVMAKLVELGSIPKGARYYAGTRDAMVRKFRAEQLRETRADPIVVRLEAIEARLSAIEALLRAQGEEREAQ